MSEDQAENPIRGQAPFWLVLVLYNLLTPVLFLALLPGWFRRARARGRWHERLGERLGLPPAKLRDWCESCGPVWIHAVSVGECGVALRLLGRWLEEDRQERFVVTTTTATGRSVLEAGLAALDLARRDRVRLAWAPFDLLPCACLGVRSLRPSRLVLTEAEWWPNWVALVRARGGRIDLFNARMSPRSAQRVARFAWLVGPLFRRLDWIGLQREEDRAGFAALGVDSGRLEVTGSVKYDRSGGASADLARVEEFRALLECLPGDSATPLVMGVSTFAGEEEMLCRVSKALTSSGVVHRLALVPRHAERGSEIRRRLESAGWRVWQRSRAAEWVERGDAGANANANANAGPAEVLLVDSTGELRAWLELAAVAVIGKSWGLGERGGQNPVEPIEAGAAVICGPQMDNFRALVAEMVEAGAMVRIDEPEPRQREAVLTDQLRTLLGDSTAREAAVLAGRARLAGHQGATQRTVDSLRRRPV